MKYEIYQSKGIKKRNMNELIGIGIATMFMFILSLFMIGGIITDRVIYIIIGVVGCISHLIIILFCVFMIKKSKNFIIYSDGIQYIRPKLFFIKNYKDHVIPFSKIKEIRLLHINQINEYNIEFIDISNKKFIIGSSNVGKKINGEWIFEIPLEQMIELWRNNREVQKEIIRRFGYIYLIKYTLKSEK